VKRQSILVSENIKEFFSKINESITKARNAEHLLTLISKTAVDEFDADRSSIFLRDEKTGQLRLIAGTGIPKEVIENHPVAEHKNISYWVAEHKKPIILNGPVKKDARFQSLSKTAISSAIVIPLIFENSVIGVFSVSRTGDEKSEFDEDDMVLFRFLGDLVVLSLQLLVTQEKKIHSEQLAAIGLATAELVHSLKNLLVGIFGATELLNVLIQQNEWDSVKEHWNLLADNIKNLSTVVNEVLSYSRTSSITKENVILQEILQQICNFIKPRCNISNIKLSFVCPEEKIILWANREALYNAIMNIVDNAIKVMPDGGELKIICETEVDSVRIKISDTGTGISEENISRIFEPFFTTDKKRGTGIGLALTKKIVESHAGKIMVESKVGKGSTFIIELPIITDSN
jgi:signal transduction histidine kinase